MDRGDDDLDRLLARAVAAPAELETRLTRRLVVARRSRRLLLALAGDAACLLILGVVAVLIGDALAAGGGRELLALPLHDHALAREYPREYLSALVQALPWALICALLLDGLAMIALTRYLLHAADARLSEARR